jgi:hypothetical protein
VENAKSAVFSVRVTPRDLAAIRALADEAGLSQSEFVVRRLLGRDGSPLERRVVRLEARLARLERRSYGVELSDEEADAITAARN